ncbi:hypothetical protein B0H14DRAFT_3131131 [Mycena olivaceomarginata]|nr:hypothetical protein B0H14DRAFT_3131131 [Mycena olivaceomarginata]
MFAVRVAGSEMISAWNNTRPRRYGSYLMHHRVSIPTWGFWRSKDQGSVFSHTKNVKIELDGAKPSQAKPSQASVISGATAMWQTSMTSVAVICDYGGLQYITVEGPNPVNHHPSDRRRLGNLMWNLRSGAGRAVGESESESDSVYDYCSYTAPLILGLAVPGRGARSSLKQNLETEIGPETETETETAPEEGRISIYVLDARYRYRRSAETDPVTGGGVEVTALETDIDLERSSWMWMWMWMQMLLQPSTPPVVISEETEEDGLPHIKVVVRYGAAGRIRWSRRQTDIRRTPESPLSAHSKPPNISAWVGYSSVQHSFRGWLHVEAE